MNEFNAVPRDVMIYILSMLSIKDLHSTNQVSRLFHQTAQPLMYGKMLALYFPHHYIPLKIDNRFNYRQHLENAIKFDYRHTQIEEDLGSTTKPFTAIEIAIFQASKMGDLTLFTKYWHKISDNKETIKYLLQLTDQANRNFLQWAGYFGHQAILDFVFYSLSSNIGINDDEDLIWDYGVEKIELAIFCNQIDFIKRTRNDILDHYWNEHGMDMIITATTCCHLELLEFLVNDPKLPVNVFAFDSNCPAIHAAGHGNQTMILFWIKAVYLCGKNLTAMIISAVHSNNSVSLQHLLDLCHSQSIGVDVEVIQSRNEVYLSMPLKLCLYHYRHPKLALMMLMTENYRASCLLDSAASNDNPYQFSKALNQLLADKIFNTIKNFYLNQDDQFDSVKIDESGNTIFHWIAYCNQIDVLNSIDVTDASVFEIRNMATLSPVELASICGHVAMMKLFVRHKFDINVKDKYQSPSLHYAASHGHTELVRYLLSCPGVEIDKCNLYYETILITACKHGHYDTAALLLQQGADVNGHEKDNTPLITAAKNGHSKIVGLLLSSPGIETERCVGGCTALELAQMNNHDECVKLLVGRKRNCCVIL